MAPTRTTGYQRRGPDHPLWRGDEALETTKRSRAQRTYSLVGVTCERNDCDRPATDRHHKNGDTGNNARSNLEFLCRRHHMEVDGRLSKLAAHRPTVQPPKACSNCGKPSKPLRRGRCGACNEYLRRKGVERAVDPEKGHAREHKGLRPCSNCARLSNPLCKGRCRACHKYLDRTGEERPVDPVTGEPLVRRFVGLVRDSPPR